MKGLSKARTAFQRCPDSEPTPERPHFHTGRGRRANLGIWAQTSFESRAGPQEGRRGLKVPGDRETKSRMADESQTNVGCGHHISWARKWDTSHNTQEREATHF